MNAPLIAVEVVYALPERQTLIALTLSKGATAADAIAASGILVLHPELQARDGPIGVFGRIVEPGHVLENGDRVEIYRPLVADPKESRNARVEKKRQARVNARNMRAGAQTKKTTPAFRVAASLC